MGTRSVLTTWEAGRYCGTSPYTVRHWVNTGRLPAYTTPGGHRRIRRQDLDAFLVAHGMPLPSGPPSGTKNLLLLMEDGRGWAERLEGWSESLSVRAATSPFEAGLLLAALKPQLFLVDLDSPRWDGLAVLRESRSVPELGEVLLAALARGPSVEILEELQRLGVVRCFGWPLEGAEIHAFLKKLFPYCLWSPAL